jgi:ADP-ribose pyrophosphatase YjhB (NUDIX family)
MSIAPGTGSAGEDRIAAEALFFSPSGQVLLVEPVEPGPWRVPVSYPRNGESPADACVRTVTGTLGLTPRTARLLAVDWLPAGGHGDTVVFVFDAGTLESDEPEQLLFDPAHFIGWQLADPADLYRLDPPEKRRTEAAVRARTTGETVYLERGRPPA